MTLFVQPIGGLCNRLRVIISYLLVARSQRKKLVVFWVPHAACLALFKELFVIPVATDLEIREPALGPPGGTTVTCYRHPDAPPESEWIPTVMEVLVPLVPLQARIDELLGVLGSDFTAVHIRRTDHNSNYDKDADYVTFGAAGSGKVFAATDNIQSMVTLRRGLGDRLVYGGKFAKAGIRMTAVNDAVVDLWTSARASRFKGTYYSSFSDWIEMMRMGLGSGPVGDLSA
jgi:hypothetical protein